MKNKELKKPIPVELDDDALESVSGGRSGKRLKPVVDNSKKLTCPACGVYDYVYFARDSNHVICGYCDHRWEE